VQIATAAGRAGPLEFEQVLGDLYPALVRRLTLVVGDAEEAKDLVQTTYLRAYEGWARFDGRDGRAWLYTIGLRLAFRERRRRSRWRALFAPTPDEGVAWDPEHASGLWEALKTLRREERAALLLNVVDGYTQAEIAGMLGVPVGTVASWISRAKARARDELGKE
jgi:RNA polymerase sigma-70 factor, ECF subfamily